MNKIILLILGFGLILSVLFFSIFTKQTNAQDLDKDQLLDLISPNDIVGETIINDTVYFNYLGGTVTLDRTILSENIEQISNNIYKIYSGKSFEYTNGNWNFFEYATTTLLDYNERYVDKLGFRGWLIPPAIAQTYYSNASDGYIGNDEAVWATARNALAGDSISTAGATEALMARLSSTYKLRRIFLPFDTSGIDDDCEIASSTISFESSAGSGGSHDVYVSSSTPADPESLVVGDYDTFNWNSLGTVSVNHGASYQRFYVVLSNTDDTVIDVEGFSTFVLTRDNDFEDSAPADADYVTFYMADQAGTDNDPFLLIETENCEEEEETASTTTATPGSVPIFNDIAIISGYTEIYTDSTTTPSETRYHVYHIPFLLFVVFWAIFSFIFGRFLIEIIIWFRK